ncbi:hypothetical protein OCF84_20940 (plasmid) [Shewanella xiamenensis]|uniref:Uncharacterized protein n=1 Tax=Shewanella xiamenensis TaxID=332186 RepID=A0ABT6UFL6_9GAMM|nr:hypothetical protein [Shewanella xiamenensis]MDI5833263.1 hypothetical protein [Shewanella xiamenensis]WHF57986.1 hypothetical protein OCF84_20940 [Shewanella xiamenensis]
MHKEVEVTELQQWQKDLITLAVHICPDAGTEPVLVISPARMGKFTQAILRKRAKSIASK